MDAMIIGILYPKLLEYDEERLEYMLVDLEKELINAKGLELTQ